MRAGAPGGFLGDAGTPGGSLGEGWCTRWFSWCRLVHMLVHLMQFVFSHSVVCFLSV